MTRTALHRRDDASSTNRGRKAACVLTAALAVLVAGSAALAEPEGQEGPSTTAGAQLAFSAFNDKVFLEARRSGSPVVLYFEAEWCGPCKEMHAKTFRAPAVLEAAAGIRFFRVDLSRPDHDVDLVKKSFRVIGAPTIILFGPDGKESGRRFGFIPPDDFAKMLGASRKPPQST